MSTEDKGTAEKVQNWWSTEIIDMRPGKIRIRGENIEDLIGKISFVQMIWLMIQGDCHKSRKHVSWKRRWWLQWIMAHRLQPLLPREWLSAAEIP